VNQFIIYCRRAVAGIIGPPPSLLASVSQQGPVNERLDESEVDIEAVTTRRVIPPSNICNLNEVGLAFEEISQTNLADKGSKTVPRITIKNAWQKRQMTVVLASFADGLPRIKPLVIFHGTEGAPGITKKEAHLYANGVVVKYNKTAWNNENLMLEWLEEQWKPAIDSKSFS
jgi:DDE superfamily endonuclease